MRELDLEELVYLFLFHAAPNLADDDFATALVMFIHGIINADRKAVKKKMLTESKS
jgi:hypothetical protein